MADVKTSALTNERTAVQITDDTQIVVGVTDLGDLTQSFRCRLSAMKGTAGPYGDEIRLGGSTATEVMLKRSGTKLQTRLADDTAYAGLTVGDELQFGGTSSSEVMFKRAGTTLQLRLADDSNNARLVPGDVIVGGNATITQAGSHQLELRNAVNPQSLTIYNTYSSGANYERGFVRWSANVFEIGTERIGGTSRPIELVSAAATIGFYYSTSNLGAQFNGAKLQTRRIGLSTSITSDQVILETAGDGDFKITNSSLNGLNTVVLGNNTASFPMLKINGSELQIRVGDDTADAPLSCSNFTMINGTTATTLLAYNTYTSGAVFERGFFRWSANELHIGTEHTGGSVRDMKFYRNGTYYFGCVGGYLYINQAINQGNCDIRLENKVRIECGSTGNKLLLRNNNLDDAAMLVLGPESDSYVGLKRSSTELQVRLGADGGDAPLRAERLTVPEMTAPTGTLNEAKIYAEDNGSGKTRLMVIFGTGAAQQIAIEP